MKYRRISSSTQSELREILGDNSMYAIYYYMLWQSIVSPITRSTYFVARFGAHWWLACSWVMKIVTFATAVDFVLFVAISRGDGDRVCGWCRTKAVAVLLVLHLSTHRRARRVLRRIKLEGEGDAVIGQTISFKEKEACSNCDFCTICWDEFNQGESLTLAPKCNHYFHSDCFYHWLSSSYTCPLCRTSVV